LDDPANVDALALKPGAGVQVPEGVVQAAKPIDLIAVDCAAVNVKLYVVKALARELPSTTCLPVTSSAEAILGINANVMAIAVIPHKICLVSILVFIFVILTFSCYLFAFIEP
jgi:hypothetical protein